MPNQSPQKKIAPLLVRRIVARDPEEVHRTATPLELLFDLCFVVAIAYAATSLHHELAATHILHGLLSYAMVFFAIWWAWMGFTWYASAFDTDDVPYRIKVLIQMIGALVIAAGVPRAFEHLDYSIITLGYAIMRVGLVALWLRASRIDSPLRFTARRYALGISLLQCAWIALLFTPNNLWIVGWCILAPLELLVPIWAESKAKTPFHPHHIAERYGLMTIIVIGESVLASTVAVQSIIDSNHLTLENVGVILGAPLIFFSMWWLYFANPHHESLESMRQAFLWGYGHYFVLGSAAAAGAGIAVTVEIADGHGQLSPFWASQSIAIPVAIYLLSLWSVQAGPRKSPLTWIYLCGIIATLAAPLLFSTPLAIGLVLVLITAAVVLSQKDPSHPKP